MILNRGCVVVEGRIGARQGRQILANQKMSSRKQIAWSADTDHTLPRFRNSGNVMEKPRGRGWLQAVASVPPARQSGRICRRRTADRKQGTKPKRDCPCGWQERARVSTVLGALRLAEVVRYDTDGKRHRYRLKHPREVRNLLASLSRFVKVASVVACSFPCFRNSGNV